MVKASAKWPIKRIGELADICRGSSPRPITDPKYTEGGTIPWVKIADATGSGKFIRDTAEHVNEYGASFSRYLPEGTILVAASGVTLGFTTVLGIKGCAHDGWLILQNLRGIDRDFAYYYLKLVGDQFHNSSSGAAIQNINTDILRQTIIPCPPLPVQRRIAGILSAYDDLIENNQRRIRILDQMARALYREWFVHFRFPGHEKVPRVPSPLGDIPKGWEIKPLGELAAITMGLSPKGDTYNGDGNGIPLINGPVEFGERFTKKVKWSISPTKLCKAGDLVVCVRGSTTGRNVKSDGTYCLGRGVCGISSAFQSFVDLLFANELPTLLAQTSGSTFPSWTGPQLKSHPVLSPPSSVVARFDSLVRPMIDAVLQYSRQIENLRLTRNLLLPRLMSDSLHLNTA